MIANIVFYSQLLISLTIWFTWYYTIGKNIIVHNIDVLGKIGAAVILVYSISRLRRSFNNLARSEFQVREKLMCAHTIIFLVQILFVMAQRISSIFLDTTINEYSDNTEDCFNLEICMEKACPIIQAGWFLYAASDVLNLSIMVLLIYMSVKFSQPMNKYWKESYDQIEAGSEDNFPMIMQYNRLTKFVDVRDSGNGLR